MVFYCHEPLKTKKRTLSNLLCIIWYNKVWFTTTVPLLLKNFGLPFCIGMRWMWKSVLVWCNEMGIMKMWAADWLMFWRFEMHCSALENPGPNLAKWSSGTITCLALLCWKCPISVSQRKISLIKIPCVPRHVSSTKNIWNAKWPYRVIMLHSKRRSI